VFAVEDFLGPSWHDLQIGLSAVADVVDILIVAVVRDVATGVYRRFEGRYLKNLKFIKPSSRDQGIGKLSVNKRQILQPVNLLLNQTIAFTCTSKKISKFFGDVKCKSTYYYSLYTRFALPF